MSVLTTVAVQGDQTLREKAIDTMRRSTRYFRSEVATRGGYLWRYASDLGARQGERGATASQIWVQPPGTPTIGSRFLDAYEATGDTIFLHGAVDASHALVWGQLSTGGWDYLIDFDPEKAEGWYYRRDVERGDVGPGDRKHTSVFDDDTSQSAMRLLMRVDAALDFKDAEIHSAVEYGLDGILGAQYSNGAWPQRYDGFQDPTAHTPRKARYADAWSRTWTEPDFHAYYTFNDGAMEDLLATMLQAHEIYGRSDCLEAAKRCGAFMIRAQMPEPQPGWP